LTTSSIGNSADARGTAVQTQDVANLVELALSWRNLDRIVRERDYRPRFSSLVSIAILTGEV
jgi:hypothetical protein